MPKITFLPLHETVNVISGIDLVKACELNPHIPFKFGCRNGNCGTCLFKVIEGSDHLTKKTKEEQKTLLRLGKGKEYRLACQCAINGDIIAEV